MEVRSTFLPAHSSLQAFLYAFIYLNYGTLSLESRVPPVRVTFSRARLWSEGEHTGETANCTGYDHRGP